MLKFAMSLFNWRSELSFKERLGENAHVFISEIMFINLVRLRIMSVVAFAIFILLWIWDIIQFFEGKWNESIGYQSSPTSIHFFYYSYIP